MKCSWIIRLLMAITLFRQEAYGQSSGGDVYNFYFQKAPGPQTVIQGGGKPENSVQVRETPNGVEVTQPERKIDAAPAVTAPLPVPMKDEEPDFKKWSVRLGSEVKIQQVTESVGNYYYQYETTKSLAANGTAIGGTYAFNKYIAADATLLFARRLLDLSDPFETKEASGVFPYLGVELTPIRVIIFNYDLLDLSFIAGVTTKGLETNNRQLTHYTGMKMALNISSNFAVQAVGRWTPDSPSSEGGANLVWRF